MLCSARAFHITRQSQHMSIEETAAAAETAEVLEAAAKRRRNKRRTTAGCGLTGGGVCRPASSCCCHDHRVESLWNGDDPVPPIDHVNVVGAWQDCLIAAPCPCRRHCVHAYQHLFQHYHRRRILHQRCGHRLHCCPQRHHRCRHCRVSRAQVGQQEPCCAHGQPRCLVRGCGPVAWRVTFWLLSHFEVPVGRHLAICGHPLLAAHFRPGQRAHHQAAQAVERC
mmetsp:Transcript_6305/g.12083  ORF Transcript_6305/g.12083 Transcript_6305/m.12083 type:complete len:224 (-) Transcript_6305:1621-2292(-)